VNHLTEEQLVQYHYGDAGDGAAVAAIEEHLHGCATCQADIDGLRQTLSAVDAFPVPARGEGYGSEVWARLQPELDRARETRWQRLQSFVTPQRLLLAGGAAVLVAAAFVAGLTHGPWRVGDTAQKVAPASQETSASIDRDQVRERVLLVAVGDHLERSQMALVELVNASGGPTVDISAEQERARDLVTENRLYRQTALTTGDAGVESVLDDLERVLVEIANSPSTMTAAEFGKVRSRIERQGIIFKVRVFGDRVREREANALAPVAEYRGGV
jgi:hypothetical protein